jgi:Alginate lyase
MDQRNEHQVVSRRGMLQVAGGLAITGLAAGTAVSLSGSSTPATLVNDLGATGGGNHTAASRQAFVHPGLLHTEADFKRMRARVHARDQPWRAGWDTLAANAHSQSGWRPNPLVTVVRGGAGENYGTLYNDIAAAYQNAMRWRITGDRAHGDTAREILNAWSATLKTVTGDADRFIAAGIYGYEFANAAEIMRDYRGFRFERFQTMMLDVLFPLNYSFLTNHNGAFITNYWGSWDMLTMASILAIGILCDEHDKVNRAIHYFKHGAGNGSIMHEIPHLVRCQVQPGARRSLHPLHVALRCAGGVVGLADLHRRVPGQPG